MIQLHPFLLPHPHPYPIAGLGAASDGTPVAKIRRAATNADIVQFTTALLGARDVSLGAPEILAHSEDGHQSMNSSCTYQL